MASNDVKLPIYSVSREDNRISLTFDVNWAEDDKLEEILDILKKNDVKATFFIMGGWVNYSESNIEKLKLINDLGNEIGNHSYMHPDFSKISSEKISEELNKTNDVVKLYTGKGTSLCRFPSGSYNENSVKDVIALGYTPIQWSVDSVDWKQEGKDIEYNRIMKKVKSGSILLFHNNAKYTPENLERIIPELKEKGYEFKTVSELIYSNNYIVDENGVQLSK